MPSFLEIHQIRTIQLDHTSRCNLLCPQCSRTANGAPNPNLQLKDLDVSDYEVLFSQIDTSALQSVLFCGNYGDAAASPTFLDCVKFLKSINVSGITIMSNGSCRNERWWADLAQVLSAPKDKVCFSIDGLEDTNGIYRRGSNFSKIEKNVQAFTGAGGRARWDFIVFQHNEHQLDMARNKAVQLGVSEFLVKKTSRFVHSEIYRKGQIKEADMVERVSGARPAEIRPPTTPKYHAANETQFKTAVNKYGSWPSYLEKTTISCKSKLSKTIFVDFDMKLWPCCWLAAPSHFYSSTDRQKEDLMSALAEFPENFNSLREHPLSQILNGPWFGGQLAESWNETHPHRLSTCGRTCGQIYDFSSGSAPNRQLFKLSGSNQN